jgi:hypothetical protein
MLLFFLITNKQILAREEWLSSVVRVGLRVEALDRLPFSLVRFFWAIGTPKRQKK